jgi:hypothetical protein
MRKILLILFISSSFCVFSQPGFAIRTPRYDSIDFETLKDIGFYFNDVDLTENRVDTLFANTIISRTYEDERIVKEYYSLITFYEKDNLLVLQTDSNLDKKIMFLNFFYEEGSKYTASKIYSTENGDRVNLEYEYKNPSEKILSYITIYPNNKNEYMVSYMLLNQDKINSLRN